MPKSIRVALVAVAVILAGTQARADDGYICDAGRLIDARPETLAKLNNTDPCGSGFVAAIAADSAGQPPAKAAQPPAPAPGKYRNAAARENLRGPAVDDAMAPDQHGVHAINTAAGTESGR